MTRTRSVVLLTALLFALSSLGCASLGLSRSGNKFNYDNAAKIQKGMAKEKVLALLEAEPRATGKAGNREHWHFEFVQNTGVGLPIPVPMLGSAGASKGQTYACDVYFNPASGKVVEVNYFTRQLGGESLSL